MRDDVEFCECCGAKLITYKHVLSKSLLRGMERLSKKGKGPHNLTEAGLTHNQRCNFQKLKYWELVAKEDTEGKGGVWFITNKGWQFLRNEIRLQRFVYTFRGSVERFDGEEVGIKSVTGGWWYIPDYIENRT